MGELLPRTRRVLRAVGTLVLVAALLAGARAHPAAAQVAPDASWRTINSSHFRITYEDGLEQVARHAAASAERAYAALSVLVADAPRSRIDLIVADNLDFSNGYASPLPTNRIVVFAKPPVDVLDLQHTRDWIELVVTHELAHIFHLDVTSGFGRVLRAVLGRAPIIWPVFPALGTPAWSIEGLAVGVESAVTGFGRVHGSYHEMVVRTAALEDEIDDIDRLSSSSAQWPGTARVYIYGSLFMDYLARRYGPDATARIVRSTAGAVIPPPLWFDRVGRNALGITFRKAYREWRTELENRYGALASRLQQEGLTTSEPVTTHRAQALYPRFSPDGSVLAYAADDWRRPARTRVLDFATGEERWSRRRHLLAPAAWLPDGTLVTSDIDFIDQFRVLSDLFTVSAGDDDRITRGARLQEPDATRDGRRIVAVENAEGTNRLVLLERSTRRITPLTPFDPDVHWALPRFSPDGGSIAVGRFRSGGSYDIAVLDTLGGLRFAVPPDSGVSAAPAWSPDGRWLLFWSDRTGVPNIYAADVAQLTHSAAVPGSEVPVRQVTNVTTGAFFPEVSPDGRWLVFSAYHHNGFRIERTPFDPGTWRAPLARLALVTPVHDGARDALSDSIARAVATADTTTGSAEPYGIARSLQPHFWLPVLETGATDDTYLGVWSFSQDLVDRHVWNALFAVDPSSGRTRGYFDYTFRGLPTLPGVGLHPTLSATVNRWWDVFIRRRRAGEPYADEREDVAALTLGLARNRIRTFAGINLGAELIRRSRYLHDAPGFELVDPADDLFAWRGSASVAHFVRPPLAISRENGFAAQVGARRVHDRNVARVVTDEGTAIIDAAYRELTTWDAAYLALPLPGFARHVLAGRFSALHRTGPGATRSSIGGASGSGFAAPSLLATLGGSSLLLPVRGYARGVRAGTRAWTASAEYRFPIALIDRSLRPIPTYLDRLSGAAFADAGHAWCDPATAGRLPAAACPSTDASDPPLLSAGAELTALLTLLGAAVPLRAGVGFPLRRVDGSSARFYLLTGASF